VSVRLAVLATVLAVRACAPGTAGAQEVGTLALTGPVAGVEVFLGDQRLGEIRAGMALIVDNVPTGRQQLRARRQGYRDWERTVEVLANRRTSVVVDIEQLQAQPMAARVLYEEDLLGERKTPVFSGQFCSNRYGDVGYIVKNVAKQGTCEFNLFHLGTFPNPVRVEVSIRRLGGPQDEGAGIKFGMATKETALEAFNFTLDATGRYSLWHKKGQWNALIDRTRDATAANNALNTLAVEIAGTTIRCYLNGRLVGSAVAPEAPQGYIGFFIDAPGVEVAFSNLRVLELAR
jgi:hypothetical protein